LTETLLFLHSLAAQTLLVYAVALALWGTYRYFRNRELSGGYRSGFLIMAGLTALQGLIGLSAIALGGRPRVLHIVYGVFAVVFLPGAYAYAQQGSRRRETLILAGAAWIVSIAYLRGMATGGPS